MIGHWACLRSFWTVKLWSLYVCMCGSKHTCSVNLDFLSVKLIKGLMEGAWFIKTYTDAYVSYRHTCTHTQIHTCALNKNIYKPSFLIAEAQQGAHWRRLILVHTDILNLTYQSRSKHPLYLLPPPKKTQIDFPNCTLNQDASLHSQATIHKIFRTCPQETSVLRVCFFPRKIFPLLALATFTGFFECVSACNIWFQGLLYYLFPGLLQVRVGSMGIICPCVAASFVVSSGTFRHLPGVPYLKLYICVCLSFLLIYNECMPAHFTCFLIYSDSLLGCLISFLGVCLVAARCKASTGLFVACVSIHWCQDSYEPVTCPLKR